MTRWWPFRPSFLVLAELAAFTATSSAAAEPPPIVSFAEAPAECPSSAFLNGRFFELVGNDAPSRGSATVAVQTIAADRHDFVVEIETTQGRGVRRFSAKTCALGAETAALIVALSLFPERTADLERKARAAGAPEAPDEAAAPAASPPVPTVAAAAKEPPKPAQPEKPARPTARARATPQPMPSERRPRILASLNAGVDANSMPRVAPGLGIALGVELFHELLFEATVAAFAAQTVTRSAGRSADFTSQSAGVHGCYPLKDGWLTVMACAGAVGIRTVGQGRGAQRSHQRVAIYGGPAIGASVRVRIAPPLQARIHAESFVPFGRPRFLLERTEVYEPPPVGFSVFAGPELSF